MPKSDNLLFAKNKTIELRWRWLHGDVAESLKNFSNIHILGVLNELARVDSPDMVRGQMNTDELTLTDIKIDIKRVPNKKTFIAAMVAADASSPSKDDLLEEACKRLIITRLLPYLMGQNE
ncbi:hypothetical protein QVD17_07198 [Tagetes erecta]|uniref:Uncharacterized protein n=1 Tax=Tagetes erecta TaxID=13708 RepID=A0AAD8LF10_TARER|nr:hypothetical protein QVD17_07198 [Tagetes erecta]